MDPVAITPWVRAGLFLVLALVFSWVAAGFRPFTQPENAAVAVPALLVVVVSWRRSDFGKDDRAGAVAPPGAGIAVWASILVLLTAWELIAYVSSPRDAHPTLSSISDSLMSVHVGRAAAFFGWLVVGWALFLLPRRAR
jgi:hypothetical protein